ncbi:putative YbeD-like domain superfamily protein [Helianthus annuus]|nr:putative YbeD-like domain superfamily protein [Helianthus annuus]KAJ0552037.1 putative YbeD-like domain superfamily protein [Helianthus annuus]KAJ0720954.1 putative YbeD-like domain superfamily protein [Helianthus annuus]
MARRAVTAALILNQAWQNSLNRTFVRAPILNSRCGYRIIRHFCSGRRTGHPNDCFHDKNVSLVTENMQEPPPGTSKTEGQTTNMVFGSTVIDGSTGEWLTLNEKINTYPSARRFTAIGLGGDDFVQSMVVAVESVIQHPVPQRVSSGGKYVSVNIGPVRVVSREQVIFLSVDLFNKSNGSKVGESIIIKHISY